MIFGNGYELFEEIFKKYSTEAIEPSRRSNVLIKDTKGL